MRGFRRSAAASVLARSVYSGPCSVARSEIGLGLIAGLVFLLCCRHWGLYRFECVLQPQARYGRLAAAAFFGVIAVVCLLFLLKNGADYSRGALMLSALFAPPLVIAERQLLGFGLSHAIASDYVRGRRAVIIGEFSDSSALRRERSSVSAWTKSGASDCRLLKARKDWRPRIAPACDKLSSLRVRIRRANLHCSCRGAGSRLV